MKLDKNTTIEATKVEGGWRMQRSSWLYDGRPHVEAWDQDIDFVDEAIFATKDGCERAIEAKFLRQVRPNFMHLLSIELQQKAKA
jgi:hypothetical protein